MAREPTRRPKRSARDVSTPGVDLALEADVDDPAENSAGRRRDAPRVVEPANEPKRTASARFAPGSGDGAVRTGVDELMKGEGWYGQPPAMSAEITAEIAEWNRRQEAVLRDLQAPLVNRRGRS